MRSRFSPETFSEERLRREWSEPGFDRERDARLGEAGYAAVERLDDEKAWIELHGEQPEPLLTWALERVQGGRVFAGSWQDGVAVREAIEAAGFRHVRHSYRMMIDLDSAGSAPAFPNGIEVRTFQAGDEHAVYETQMETFEDSWEHYRDPYERWLHWMIKRPDFDPSLWLLAVDGADVVGIALGRVDDQDPATGWISILGVRRSWRRRGLGDALLRAGFAALRDKGCVVGMLGVDAESLTGAQRLYERAGMQVAGEFDIYEKTV